MNLEGAGSDLLGPETHCMTLNFTLSELRGHGKVLSRAG